MRNFIACLLLLGLLAGLSACGADDSYLSVRTHVEPSIPATETPQQEEPPTAGNRSELRGAMLSFVRNWTEQGEIRISGYSGDLTADLTETVRYITQEDPIGAYAVDYADAELRGDAQTGTVEVSIVFRRSAAEIDAIVTVSGVNGAHAKIRQALANFDAALTLRIRSYEDADFSGYIRTYCLEHPDSAKALPEVSAAVYPETGETRILERHFTYSQPRDTLRSMQCEPEQQQRAANYIFSEARRVEALSEKLLQLLGLREQAPALEPLELERVFTRARAALGPSVAPVEPVFQPAPGVRVRGDADLLVDLLYNLVQNAARARPKDGRVSIGWHTAAEGQGVDVTVRDTGCGIPAAALARVTEPFYMVDKSRARAGGGSGMGLALCEKIAALHGGRLQIESVEGEGTAVTVRLPAADGKEGGAAV